MLATDKTKGEAVNEYEYAVNLADLNKHMSWGVRPLAEAQTANQRKQAADTVVLAVLLRSHVTTPTILGIARDRPGEQAVLLEGSPGDAAEVCSMIRARWPARANVRCYRRKTGNKTWERI